MPGLLESLRRTALIGVVAILFASAGLARPWSMDRVQRDGIGLDQAIELDLGDFDDVVSVDPGVLEVVEVRADRTVVVRGTNYGEGLLLIRRGGFSEDLVILVRPSPENERYGAGLQPIQGTATAAAWVGAQVVQARELGGFGLVGASFRQKSQTSESALDGLVEVSGSAAGIALNAVQVESVSDLHRFAVGDFSLAMGNGYRAIRWRGAEASLKFARTETRLASVGVRVAGNAPNGCCGVFDGPTDLLVTGIGSLRLGVTKTNAEAGFLLSPSLGFLPVLGIEQALEHRGVRLDASAYLIGSKWRAMATGTLRAGRFTQFASLRFSQAGVYTGPATLSDGSLDVVAQSVLRLGRLHAARLDLQLGDHGAGERRSYRAGIGANVGVAGGQLGLSSGVLHTVAGTRAKPLVQLILTWNHRAALHRARFYGASTFDLRGGLETVAWRGEFLGRLGPQLELGPRSSGSVGLKGGAVNLGGGIAYERSKLKGDLEIGVSSNFNPGITLGPYGLATLSWRVLNWLEVLGNASARYSQRLPTLSVGAQVRVSGAVRPVFAGGTIRGRAYEDVDLDGVFSEGDRVVDDLTVRVGDRSSVSKGGRYAITGLPQGTYVLDVDTAGAYLVRDGELTVTSSRTRATSVDIGLTRVNRVDIRLYADDNTNGRRDRGERLLPAEEVFLRKDGTTRTEQAPDGAASWTVETQGTAVMGYEPLLVQAGYVPLGPDQRTVEIGDRGHEIVWFPLRAQRSVRGRVCVDANANGRLDGADPCPEGTEVRMSDGRAALTGPNGAFLFAELAPGTHQLTCVGCAPLEVRMRTLPQDLTGVVLLQTPAAVEVAPAQVDHGPVQAVRLGLDQDRLKVGERIGFDVLATYQDFTQGAPTDVELRFSPVGIVRRSGDALVALQQGETQVVAVVGNVLSPPRRLLVQSLPVVGLTASPGRLELAAGDVQPLDVRALYIDGDIAPVHDELTWTSDRPDIARVEGNGVVVALSPGRAILRGEYLSVSTNPIEVRVTAGATVNAIALTPETLVLGLESRGRMYVDATLTTGRRMQLASDVQWFVEDASVVTVEEGGRIQPVGVGRTTIYARHAGLQTPRAQIEVVPAVGLIAQPTFSAIPVGGTTPLKAVEVLEDGSFREQPRARWTTSDDSIATISGSTLTAHAAGTVQVVATHRDRESLPLAIEVLASEVVELTLSPEVVEVATDDPGYVDAMAHFRNGRSAVVSPAAIWSIADRTIARVDDDGVVTGLRPGRTLLMATWMGVESEPIPVIVGTAVATVANAVIVEPAAVSLSAQGSQELAVSVLSETGHILRSTGVRWEVGDPSVAWIEGGVVKAVSVGATTLTAIHGDVRSLPVPVRVSPIVGVNAAPALGRLPVGARVDLRAIGVVDDGTLEDLSRSGAVKWTSSDPRVLRIDDDGKLLAFTAGQATVTAQWRNLKTQPMRVDVADVDLTGLAVDPDAVSIRAGGTLPLAAVAVFGDGQVADATPHVTWTTTRPEVARIDAGLLHGLTPGVADVFASWMGVDSDPVRVTVAVADAVGVILGNVSEVLLSDARIPLRATAITSDGELLDASQQTTWRVGDTAVVRVDADGFLEARGPGTTTVAGEVGGFVSPAVQVEVTSGALIRLAIDPGALAVRPDDAVELRAHAELDDGRRFEVSPQITWVIEGHGVSVDRYNRLVVEPGASARVRATHGDVRSPWAQIVATE